VVSVIPYMLTSAVRPRPRRSTQDRSSGISSFSPAKTTARSDSSLIRRSPAAAAVTSERNAVGVCERTVTSSSTSRSSSASGMRVVSEPTRTTRAPWLSAAHSSNTETSKA
jgi:hypothetical protein